MNPLSGIGTLRGGAETEYGIKCRYKKILLLAVTCTGARGTVLLSGTQFWSAKGEYGSFSLFQRRDIDEAAIVLIV